MSDDTSNNPRPCGGDGRQIPTEDSEIHNSKHIPESTTAHSRELTKHFGAQMRTKRSTWWLEVPRTRLLYESREADDSDRSFNSDRTRSNFAIESRREETFDRFEPVQWEFRVSFEVILQEYAWCSNHISHFKPNFVVISIRTPTHSVS